MKREARYANGKHIYKAFFSLVVSCVSEANSLVTSASDASNTRRRCDACCFSHFTERNQPMASSMSLRSRFRFPQALRDLGLERPGYSGGPSADNEQLHGSFRSPRRKAAVLGERGGLSSPSYHM